MTKPIPPVPPDVAEALAKGHLLEAVKRLRAASPMGLAEAKSVIEWHVRHNALRPPSASSKPAPRPGPVGMARGPAAHHHPTVHAPGRPGLSPGEVGKTRGGGAGIVVLLAVAMGLVYYFLQ
ncbi:MAG: hypothetical protein ABIR98_07470 [Usitatibacter sp.]